MQVVPKHKIYFAISKNMIRLAKINTSISIPINPNYVWQNNYKYKTYSNENLAQIILLCKM